jgi:hypothetical protein
MSRKRQQLMAIVIGLVATQSSFVIEDGAKAATPKKGEKPVHCFGINACKGTNGCAVDQNQIKLANKIFKNKFPKTTLIECAGNSDCGAKNGYLAWVLKKNEKDCFQAEGFIFEKDAKNNLIIRDKEKNGMKKG